MRERGERCFFIAQESELRASPCDSHLALTSSFKQEEGSKKQTASARAAPINSQSSAPFVVALHIITTSCKHLS